MNLSTKRLIILWVIVTLFLTPVFAETNFAFQELTHLVRTYLNKYDDYYKSINPMLEEALKDPYLITQYEFVSDEIKSVQFDIRELYPYVKFHRLIDKGHMKEYMRMLHFDLTMIANYCRNRAKGLEPRKAQITDPTLNSVLLQVIESCTTLAEELDSKASQIQGDTQ